MAVVSSESVVEDVLLRLPFSLWRRGGTKAFEAEDGGLCLEMKFDSDFSLESGYIFDRGCFVWIRFASDS